MRQLQLRFDSEDADEGLEMFVPALAAVEGVELLGPEDPAEPDRWQNLHSDTALAVTVVTQTAFVLRPLLLLWFGKGKRIQLKTDTVEVVLENLTADEIDRVLSTIDAGTLDDVPQPPA